MITMSRRARAFRILVIVASIVLGACDPNDVMWTTAEAQSTGGGLARCVVDGVTMGGKCTLADPLRSLVTTNIGMFGDGSDGVLHYDCSSTIVGSPPTSFGGPTSFDGEGPFNCYYSLARSVFASTILIDDGVLVLPVGFLVAASTSITLNGDSQIEDRGCTGGDGDAGGAGACAGGGGLGWFPFGNSGGNGNSTGGSNGGNGGNGIPNGYPGAGGGTGNGGNGAGGTGGVGGTAGSTIAASHGDIHTIQGCFTARSPDNTAIISNFSPGGGGGAGDGAGHKGGGGGGGTGWMTIASPTIITNGTSKLTVKGRGGGAGATTGNTGGGGGGAGGILCLVYTNSPLPTYDVSGGTGGAGHGTGTAGATGKTGMAMVYKVGN